MVVITSIALSAVLAILVGIIILIWPKFLNFAVGIYLIIQGILGFVSF